MAVKKGKSVDVRIIGKGGPAGVAISDVFENPFQSFEHTKGEVKEYISNPADYLNREVQDYSSGDIIGKVSDFIIENNSEENKTIFVDNPSAARYMPANSIIAYIGRSLKPIIAYPFFPPHISFPLKPGEQVWILKEKRGENLDFYYWMCRVATDRQIDDLNYTSIDRTEAVRELSREFDLSGNVSDEEFLYPALSSEKFNNENIPDEETASSIHGESIAYLEECIIEPVPRTFCKASDFLLQGSNNSAIQLTTEKFRSSEEISSNTFLSSEAKEGNLHTPLAGAIDLFVGKEKERLLELSGMSSPESERSEGALNVSMSKRLSEDSSFESYEINKIDEFEMGSENIDEGNDDPRNVFARLYLSMNGSPDANFDFINEDFESFTGSSAVLYSDYVRLFGENNLRAYNLAGNSVIDMSEDGTITLQSGEGDTAAKIILRPGGDIVVKPGSGGILYLGGDETEIAGVAVSVNTPVSPIEGQTQAQIPGITTSMGGTSFLGDPVSGLVSSKVMIKV